MSSIAYRPRKKLNSGKDPRTIGIEHTQSVFAPILHSREIRTWCDMPGMVHKSSVVINYETVHARYAGHEKGIPQTSQRRKRHNMQKEKKDQTKQIIMETHPNN